MLRGLGDRTPPLRSWSSVRPSLGGGGSQHLRPSAEAWERPAQQTAASSSCSIQKEWISQHPRERSRGPEICLLRLQTHPNSQNPHTLHRAAAPAKWEKGCGHPSRKHTACRVPRDPHGLAPRAPGCTAWITSLHQRPLEQCPLLPRSRRLQVQVQKEPKHQDKSLTGSKQLHGSRG